MVELAGITVSIKGCRRENSTEMKDSDRIQVNDAELVRLLLPLDAWNPKANLEFLSTRRASYSLRDTLKGVFLSEKMT